MRVFSFVLAFLLATIGAAGAAPSLATTTDTSGGGLSCLNRADPCQACKAYLRVGASVKLGTDVLIVRFIRRWSNNIWLITTMR